MNRFQNQVAIVTGGARGIGKGIARQLAEEGAQVIIFDIREKELAETLSTFREKNLPLEAELLDISKEDKVKESIERIVNRYKRLDIMVNSAGIVGETSIKIAEYSSAGFDHVLDVNLKGAFLLTKYALPPMLEKNYGRIIHLASISGKEGNPGMVGYSASKAGLMGLVKGVGKEYAETGITVNGIAPAVIATDINEHTDPAMLKYMIDKIPMKRLGTVEEVASLCCWIASKEASFNTGFVFDLSGGRATY